MLLRVTCALHRVLLFAYPRRFRVRYADELQRVFEEGARDASARGRRALVAHGTVESLDAVRSGIAERLWGAGPLERRPERGFAMETLVRDLRHAVRGLRRTPMFAAIAVLTIALGIGANTAIFSVVRGVLLRPLPYEDPQELVLLWGELQRRDVHYFPTSPPDLQDFRARSRQIESMAGLLTFQQPMAGADGTVEQIMTAGVTPEFFRVLGLTPMLGRDFVEEDGRPATPAPNGAAPTVNAMAILNHSFWRDRFGSDPGVIGRVVQIGGAPAEIVGVMPPGVRLHWPAEAALSRDADVFFALRVDYANANRNNVFLRVVGRLAPGATAAGAQAEFDRISAELRSEYPIKESAGFRVAVIPMHADLVRPVRPIVLVLMGAVAFVLLVACANVANLLLVRAIARERELAVRASMGGTRGRLVRQMLAESLVLGLVGAAGGVLLAAVGVRAVLAIAPADLPRLDAISIDGTVLLYTALATLLAVAVFGVVPAIRASRPQLMEILREGGRNPGLGAGRLLRNGVVIAEVALSLVLLVGAGLMARSFASLRDVDPGWNPDGLLAVDVALPFARYPEPERRATFSVQLQDRLRGVPGVRGVSAALPLPFSNFALNGRWGLESALTDPEQFRQADYIAVMPEYFDVMQTEMVEGRALNAADAADGASVVVVDERLARLAYPDGSAVGQDIFVRITTPEPVRARIVGVVRNQRRGSLVDADREAIFITDSYAGSPGLLGWIVRADGDPGAALDAIRAELRALDPEVPVSNVRPLRADLDRAMAPTRFALVLISSFAGIAVLLAAVGLYGVLSFAVRQRTAEIGVRVAFGAPRGRIVGLVVRQGLVLGTTGVAIGLLAAFGLTRLLRSLLVGVAPTDPLTFASISLLFLGITAVASWIPAMRAASLDPVRALREE